MKDLIILDYSTCKVHIYKYDREEPIDDEYVEKILGYNINTCNWMSGDMDIIKHKGILL